MVFGGISRVFIGGLVLTNRNGEKADARGNTENKGTEYRLLRMGGVMHFGSVCCSGSVWSKGAVLFMERSVVCLLDPFAERTVLSGMWRHQSFFCYLAGKAFIVDLLSSGSPLYGNFICFIFRKRDITLCKPGKICVYEVQIGVCLCRDCNHDPSVFG